MQLQLVDLVGQYKHLKAEMDAALHRVLDSGQFIQGKEVAEFEKNAARYLGARHAIGCASGTDALQVAMMAFGIKPGDEVITTPFTFVATVETIALLGARPVYADIDAATFNIDASRIEKVVTNKTKAIIPVHLYGQPADMDEIMRLAREHKLHVIEDAAQAIGAEYKGRKVGTIGEIGCISFFPSKNLGAYGDAGMMVTNDDRLADRVRMITAHGSKIRYYHDVPGVNSRLDALQAAVLDVKLKHLDEWNQARQRFAKVYDRLFDGSSVVAPSVASGRTHIFHQYTLRVKQRDALVAHLRQREVPYAIYYPVPLYRQKAFMDAAQTQDGFPVTEQLTREVLSIPMHTELTPEMQEYIASNITEFYK